MKPLRRSPISLLAFLVCAAAACGTNESNSADSGSDGGSDAGYDGGSDAGYDGGSDAGYDGGSDAGYDGGSDAGYDGGSDAGYDGGSDAGYDGGSDAGYDGGSDAGYDGGSDAGYDGGSDAGSDGGSDGGNGPLDCALCHTSATLSAAHSVHIDGGSSSSPFSCSECHTLYTSLSHESPTAVINFATVPGDIANLGGLTPAWSAATTTCASVYCHGNGAAPLSGDGGTIISITDGLNTTPNWSDIDGGQSQCNSCHGDPPVANSHIQCTSDFCNVCHVDTLQGGVVVPSLNLHVNGVVDVMPQAQWGTNDHGLGTPPPGHDTGNVDFSTCVVCHGPTPAGLPEAPQEVMTCTSCHGPGGP